jgi:hypothetical protein
MVPLSARAAMLGRDIRTGISGSGGSLWRRGSATLNPLVSENKPAPGRGRRMGLFLRARARGRGVGQRSLRRRRRPCGQTFGAVIDLLLIPRDRIVKKHPWVV